MARPDEFRRAIEFCEDRSDIVCAQAVQLIPERHSSRDIERKSRANLKRRRLPGDLIEPAEGLRTELHAVELSEQFPGLAIDPEVERHTFGRSNTGLPRMAPHAPGRDSGMPLEAAYRCGNHQDVAVFEPRR